jgi:diaminopimelate dehydrogenase
MHRRECFVTIADGADPERIEQAVKTMPDYFLDYDTTVTFVNREVLKKEHSALPHAGAVITTARTGHSLENTHILELSLKLDSNPEFTGAVLVCVARAANKMAKRGEIGCKTLLDIPPADYSAKTREELIGSLL